MFQFLAVAFFDTQFTLDMCAKFYLFEPVTTMVLVSLCSAVHVIRIHAIYDKSRAILGGLGAVLLLQVGPLLSPSYPASIARSRQPQQWQRQRPRSMKYGSAPPKAQSSVCPAGCPSPAHLPEATPAHYFSMPDPCLLCPIAIRISFNSQQCLALRCPVGVHYRLTQHPLSSNPVLFVSFLALFISVSRSFDSID